MLFVGHRMDLGLEILFGPFDAEIRLLLTFPTLRPPAAFHDGVIVAPLQNMRVKETFEPRLFACAIEPSVESGFRAGHEQRLVPLPQVFLGYVRAPHRSDE